MKVALVYDRVNKWGGAERVLLALHEIWPEAPLYTALYDPAQAEWAKDFQIKTSFLQHVPFAKNYHELYPWLTPVAFEIFNFDDFDVVISVTSAEAKGIITKPKTLHICYCLTPTRYLWSGYEQYQTNPGMGGLSGFTRVAHAMLAPTLRRWDRIASSHPDRYIAISNHVADRIRRYYDRNVEGVIYPPVGVERFKRHVSSVKCQESDYFLTVARLVGYKRVDLIVQAFNTLGWPLVIIGDGLQKNELKAKAQQNITFIDYHLTDEELVRYYRYCRAFVWAGEEDFGIAAVEAQACGKPVIAYRHGGIAEVVIPGDTGILFGEQSVESLTQALHEFQDLKFSIEACRSNSERFNEQRFQKEFKGTVERLYKTYNKS